MLSILIPIYNRDCTDLVNQLHKQGETDNIEFEIICLDDGSEQEFKDSNKALDDLSYVHYRELDENIGRSSIRNKLASEAKYEHLLFIDCDMAVGKEGFLTKYLEAIDSAGAIIGGIEYDKAAPENPAHLLRWTYGREREANSLELRKKHPYASFMTGVFLIDKPSFDTIKFDESIKRYGHEDTLFGIELSKKGIAVKHIDNPLIHKGLEDSAAFIAKTEVAVQTLAELVKSGKVRNDIKLYRVFKIVKRFYLNRLFARRFLKRKKLWLENLHSSNPDLKYFDMYRLGYLCTLL